MLGHNYWWWWKFVHIIFILEIYSFENDEVVVKLCWVIISVGGNTCMCGNIVIPHAKKLRGLCF